MLYYNIQRLVEYGWKPQWGLSCHKRNSLCFCLLFWGVGLDTCLSTFRLPFLIPHILNYAHVQVPLLKRCCHTWHCCPFGTGLDRCAGHHPRSLHILIIWLCLMEPSPGPGQCHFWGLAGVIFVFQRGHFRNSTRNRFWRQLLIFELFFVSTRNRPSCFNNVQNFNEKIVWASPGYCLSLL